MILQEHSAEYVIVTVTGMPDGQTVELSVDDGDTWHAMASIGGFQYQLKMAGPAADDTVGAVVVSETAPCVLVRINSGAVRQGEEIFVSSCSCSTS